MVDFERLELLARVAEMYYINDLSQADIARELFFSRSKVSRLLTEAKDNGLVEISVNHPIQRAMDLERVFTDKYQLKNTLILKSGNLPPGRMLRSLGRMGANYLNDCLTDSSTLGISWGTAVYEVAQAFRPRNLSDFNVVQIIGSIGFGDPAIDGPEVARHIAVNFSGKYYTLNAPVIVKDKRTRDGLIKERNIQKVIQQANQADYLLVGIGSSNPGRSGLVRAGYLRADELDQINQQTGAVGDICCCLFNLAGKYRGIDFNNRVVGMNLDQLKSTRAEVIGVAGGQEKAEAVLGALRGGLIDTLVIDDMAAEEILRIE